MRTGILLAAAAILFLAESCRRLPNDPGPTGPKDSTMNIVLAGTQWELMEFRNETYSTGTEPPVSTTIRVPEAGKSFTLRFDSETTMSGRADCRHFHGGYEGSQGRLAFHPVNQAGHECSQKEMPTEFIRRLRETQGYTYANGILTLHQHCIQTDEEPSKHRHCPTMRFRRLSGRQHGEGNLLKGTHWILRNPETHAMQPIPEIFTLKFDTDSSAGGRASCNSYQVDYNVTDDGGISFGMPATTRVHCGPHSYFNGYIEALRSARRYSQVNNQLTIQNASGTLQFERDEPQTAAQKVTVTDISRVDIRQDPVHVVEVRQLEGYHIELTLEYSGGCREHDFHLFAHNELMPGNATDFAQIYLSHNAHGDMCEAWITKKIVFDMKPLIERWHAYPHRNRILSLTFNPAPRLGGIRYTE